MQICSDPSIAEVQEYFSPRSLQLRIPFKREREDGQSIMCEYQKLINWDL